MHRYTLLVSLLAAVSAGVFSGQAAPDPAFAALNGDLLARIHFAGTAQVSADPQAAELNKLFAFPAAAAMREHTLKKLSTAPYRFLKTKISAGNTNDFAALIRPMIEDILRNESYVEVRDATNQVPELMLAVKLPNDRAQLWQAYLSTILNSWTDIRVEPIQGDGYTGWELKKHLDPNLIHFIHAGDWVLFGWGQDTIRLEPAILQRIKATKRPVEPLKNEWLDALVDLPAWNAHHPITLPLSLPVALPKMHLTFEGRKDYVRPKMTMLFSKPLDLKLDPWKIPTSYIHNPIVSFTAVRGLGAWLGDLPEIKQLNPPSVPNQLIFWSVGNAPFGSCVVAPVPGASNYLAKIAPAILGELNSTLARRPMTSQAVWTNGRIKIGMPFVSPYLTTITDPVGDFVLASLFPMMQRPDSPPLPRDLMREIGSKPNLVMYSWEINAERLQQWHSIDQVQLMTSSKFGPTVSSPTFKWLQDIRTNLVNCGTEITLTAPNELTLVRNAPLGFNGLELTKLEYWFDAPEFPLSSFYPRPTPAMLRPHP